MYCLHLIYQLVTVKDITKPKFIESIKSRYQIYKTKLKY